MIEIRKTEVFAKWIDGLDDIHARARILVRGRSLIILLGGRDKCAQAKDIKTALHLARNL